jgi:regulatory protein
MPDPAGLLAPTAPALDIKAAWLKITAYCAYQERCSQEVLERLKEYGIKATDKQQLLSRLREEKYLNEERYARSYAGGKFRMKQWGRVKISQQLRMKGISNKLIADAMATEILDEEYLAELRELVAKKAASLGSLSPLQKKQRVYSYACGKGYESELVLAELARLD